MGKSVAYPCRSGDGAVGAAREHVEAGEGEAEVPKITIVSDAVRGTKGDLDGKGLQVKHERIDEQIVDMPVPQIAAKIPEVVETVPQEHVSDDLPRSRSSARLCLKCQKRPSSW